MKNWILNKLIQKVTRVDVIDYRNVLDVRKTNYVKNVELQLQDNDKTLKIFMNYPARK